VADRDRRHPGLAPARRHALKPGSATKPLPGVKPQLVDADGKVLEGATEGNLVITDSWPGQMRTVYGDHGRFFDTYFSTYPGKYFTGDGCRATRTATTGSPAGSTT
jgi:acyl-coenzyme A synthetase/AMP-(fatty) acid ligase